MCYENKIRPKILLMKYLSAENYRLYDNLCYDTIQQK